MFLYFWYMLSSLSYDPKHQNFPSLSSRTRNSESLDLRLVSDSVSLYMVRQVSVLDSDSNFSSLLVSSLESDHFGGLLCQGNRHSDSKYPVSRFKTHLSLGLGLVWHSWTRLGLGIYLLSRRVSDSESRLKNPDSGNSDRDLGRWANFWVNAPSINTTSIPRCLKASR